MSLNQVKIRGVSVVRPEYEYTTPEIVAYLEKTWLKKMPPEIRRMALRIIEGAEIDRRAAPFPREVRGVAATLCMAADMA